MKRKKIREILINRWKFLYSQGVPIIEISKRSGVSRYLVRKHLAEAGAIKERTIITVKMIKEWTALYKTGNYNCNYIAKKYNVARETVVKYLHMYGVKTSRKVPHLVEERI